MKMCETVSKRSHKSVLGADSALRNILSKIRGTFRVVTQFWACSAHFHDLASKQSLFLI